MKFQVGDIVKAFGLTGQIEQVYHNMVIAHFKNGRTTAFELDGKYIAWHEEPSLVLVERPKKKVVKYQAIYKFTDGKHDVTFDLFTTEASARQHLGSNFVRLYTENPIEVDCE